MSSYRNDWSRVFAALMGIALALLLNEFILVHRTVNATGSAEVYVSRDSNNTYTVISDVPYTVCLEGTYYWSFSMQLMGADGDPLDQLSAVNELHGTYVSEEKSLEAGTTEWRQSYHHGTMRVKSLDPNATFQIKVYDNMMRWIAILFSGLMVIIVFVWGPARVKVENTSRARYGQSH